MPNEECNDCGACGVNLTLTEGRCGDCIAEDLKAHNAVMLEALERIIRCVPMNMDPKLACDGLKDIAREAVTYVKRFPVKGAK